MKRFLRRAIWRIVKPTITFEWGSLPASNRPFCRIYILGALACSVRGKWYDNGLVFEEENLG